MKNRTENKVDADLPDWMIEEMALRSEMQDAVREGMKIIDEESSDATKTDVLISKLTA